MLSIKTIGTVSEDGKLIVDLKEKIKAGKHNVVVVLEEEPLADKSDSDPASIIGIFRDDADLLDEIVNSAMLDRENARLRV